MPSTGGKRASVRDGGSGGRGIPVEQGTNPEKQHEGEQLKLRAGLYLDRSVRRAVVLPFPRISHRRDQNNLPNGHSAAGSSVGQYSKSYAHRTSPSSV